ncbi:MAG: GGDEF domain-containing protein [Planctomycetes bacterium]|nr:GGDEF domain-containing protein [Planctomycetota bacterium]
MKSQGADSKPKHSVRRQIRLGLLAAFAIPLVLTCAVMIGHTVRSERHVDSQRQLNRARVCASMIEPIALARTGRDSADFLEAVKANDSDAVRAMREWASAAMIGADADGVALLDAQGELLCKWPAGFGLDFRAPGFDVRERDFAFRSTQRDAFPAMLVAVTPIDRGPQFAPQAYVGLAVVDRGVVGAVFERLWPIAVAMVLTAALAAFLVQRMLSKHVFAPLAAFARMSSRSKTSGSGESSSAEIQRIASQFGELHEELRDAQKRSVVLERRMESNVVEETRRIHGMLSRARKDAEHDALTGLANRRFLDEHLQPIFEKHAEQQVNIVIAMFDVDNFKPLNDNEGHAAGDEILRFFGDLLRGSLREHDVGIRYGGDEFAAILVDISEKQAFQVCDRIVKFFAQQVAAMDIKTKVTLSSGFASRSETNAASAADLLSLADAALYESKRGGKNQVVGA